MPLAAVGVFAMVLGVLATLNLGQAVLEKIRLQNTADSAAYSLAVKTARTFNYLAFLNRAQIAHYNTAVAIQSYTTWVGYHLAAYSTTLDMLDTLQKATDAGYLYYGCEPPYRIIGCPYKPAAAAMMGVLRGARASFKSKVNLFKQGDKLGKEITEAMQIFNHSTMFITALLRAVGILTPQALSAMQAYIKELDPDIKFTSGGRGWLLNFGLNAFANWWELKNVFDEKSGVNPIPGTLSEVSKLFTSLSGKTVDDSDARRLMAELCNATRSPSFLSSRRGSGGVFMVSEASSYMHMLAPYKMGQSRFTSSGSMDNAKVRSIRKDSNYPDAKYLSADDWAKSGVGSAINSMLTIPPFVYYNPTNKLGDAISAYKSMGQHYLFSRFKGADKTGGYGAIMPPAMPQSSSISGGGGDRHTWKGFSYYFKFKPNPERTDDYGQPSTWFILNKSHEDFQTQKGSHANPSAPWYGNWTMEQNGKKMSLDTTIGGKKNSPLPLLEGLTVISRGMVYYHRPDNWTEHPNMFNPFWRARLAPVGQKLQNLWDKAVTKNISTSSTNAVIKGAVNGLKNAQMDAFTAIVSSIITH